MFGVFDYKHAKSIGKMIFGGVISEKEDPVQQYKISKREQKIVDILPCSYLANLLFFTITRKIKIGIFFIIFPILYNTLPIIHKRLIKSERGVGV